MSRDLTCNESLADDGTGTNFSPNQGRFNQAQQLFSTNPAQSLALLREQLLQQQLQNQQPNSNQLAASLLRAQNLGPNIDALGGNLASNPTSITDNTLLAQLQLLQQQQQTQQQQRQAQLALLQGNLYGQLASSGAQNVGLPSTATSTDNSRLSHLHQLASALGIQVPQLGQQGVQNEASESIINQLLQQIQNQQQQQSVLPNASSIQQNNLSAPRNLTIEQQLLSRLQNPNQNVAGANTAQSAQLFLHQKINEIIQSPQILQIARELTEQHTNQQNQQFPKQELRQTASYAGESSQQRSQSDIVNQYLQRIVGQNSGIESGAYSTHQTTSQPSMSTTVPSSVHSSSVASQLQQQLLDHLTSQDRASALQQLQQQLPYEQQQILQQHLNNAAQMSARQNFVSQASSFLNNLQSAYLMQREASQTPHQISQDHQSRASVTSPRILKRSRPSSSTPAGASQKALTDYTIEELKQKQNDLLKSSIQSENIQNEQIMEEYQRIQKVINSKTLQNGTSNAASRLNEEHRHSLDQFHSAKDQSTLQQHSQSNDTRFIANIPTLAAFRQVPGQEIFDHLPKKRIKQEKQIGDKDVLLNVQRKQAKSLENLSSQPKKNTYVPKKFQNGSSGFANHETINIDNDDFENFGQRQVNNSTFKKRGRPRTTNKPIVQKLPQTIPIESTQKNVSPTRTILHDAVDIFLKPGQNEPSVDRSTASPAPRKRLNRKSKNLENEQLLSKINTLAAAVSMTSPKDSDLLSPNENRLLSPDDIATKPKKARTDFDIKSVANQLEIEKFREKHPELKDMSDLEICGVQAIMNSMVEQTGDQADAQKNKSIMSEFVANELQKGPNFWNILHKLPQKMLPNELKIVDHVFSQQNLLDLAKVEMFTKHLKKGDKTSRSKPLFRDFVDANERKNIKLMAMHLSFAQRRMDFVKDFIYESTLVRLLNGEYRQLRGDKYPQELFIEEPNFYNRINKQFGQDTPEHSKFMNSAEVECKLLNQLYRYRSQFFNELHNRPFALTPQKRITPDEMIVLNMDVSKTLFNVVEAVSTEKPYVSFEEENATFLKNSHPTVEDFNRLSFKTCEPVKENLINDPNGKRKVILRAKQTTSEVDELKQRLQSHLTTNFDELLKIHDTAYRTRCKAIELHRNDINCMLTSIQRSIRDKTGRRCSSVEPQINIPSMVPLYTRRRCRSFDAGNRSQVVNSVGVRYLQYSLASKDSIKDEPMEEDKQKEVFGPKEYHEIWENNDFDNLSQRFEALLHERQQLIAALIKLTFVDKDVRAVIEAASEKNVAVNTDEFKIDGPRSRKHKIKSSISLAQHLKRHPHLHRLQLNRRFKKYKMKPTSKISKFKRNDFNWWYMQMLNGNLDALSDQSTKNLETDKKRILRLKERNRFLAMCRRLQSESMIQYTPSLYIRDKNFIIKMLSERAFNNELNFRHLKCVALKFYSNLDPVRHGQFVKKLERLEAPRLDTLLKMRNDLTIGYLYEIPTYELRSHAPQKHKVSNSIKILPNPDAFDEMFGGKDKNPYRNPMLYPVTTSQLEINSAQLTKYRNRELDSTLAERLHNNINLTTCGRALMRLIYHTPKYGEELTIFMSHPAFKIFDSEQDQNGFPSTVYQVAITKAVEQKKLPIEKRKMPDFKNNEEAEQYFKERQKSMKEKLASILTTAHKQSVLTRRCVKTMKKLSGVEKTQTAKKSLIRQHYNSLSNRSKSQFVKRFRLEKFNENTQFESEDVKQEDNLKAPLVVPGFNPVDSVKTSLELPNYIRNDILSPQKVQLSSSDEMRSSMRGGKMSRGSRGGRKRAGKY